jgi:hypothetical protein
VAEHAVRFCYDQRQTETAASAGDSLARGFEHSDHIVPIRLDRRHTVPAGHVRPFIDRRFPVGARRERPLVALDDDHHRKAQGGSESEPLVRGARAGLAVSLVRHADLSLPASFEGQGDTIEHAQLRAERADGTQQSPLTVGEMVRVILSGAGRAGAGHVLEKHLPGLETAHQKRPEVPNGGCQPVSGFQRPGAPHRDRLLSEAPTQVTRDVTLVDEALQPLFQGTREVQVPVQLP